MNPDDLDPPKPQPLPVAPNLDEMSVEALNAYLDDLEAEKDRVRQAIAAKTAARADADSVFRF